MTHPIARQSTALVGVREIIHELTSVDHAEEIITAVHHIQARDAQWAAMPEWVRPELT